MEKLILADGRWCGTHGIGRFTQEVLSRLTHTEILSAGPQPLSARNLIWQSYHIKKNQQRFNVFFNPGFNPILHSAIPYVYTLHDLIHLQAPGKAAFAKKLYFNSLIKHTAQRAAKIITVSEYSKKIILEWLNISADKIIVTGNAINENFSLSGEAYQPGFPYLLHVGNSKPHKNLSRLVQAFALAKIPAEFKLLLTAARTSELTLLIQQYRLEDRIIFCAAPSDSKLAEYYRGAHAFIFPSLYEGFGIPPLEAMACGTPVIAANTTSLPEVVADAGLFIDPYSVESIADGIEKMIADTTLHGGLKEKGLERSKAFTWDKIANQIQQVLNSIVELKK